MRGLSYVLSAIIIMTISVSCGGAGDGGDIPEEPIKFYVGSSDGSLEHSIFLCEFDPGSGQFSVLDSFAGAKSPSYLAFSPGKDFIYAIDDKISDPALKEMSVSSFSINSENLSLKFVNSQSSRGNGPCHICCSKDGKNIFAANYSSGHSTALPLREDGSIGPASSVVIGEGSGPVTNRQKGPHAHMVSLDPENRFLLVPDLGADKVLIFHFDKESGVLSPNPEQAFLKMEAGAGPRHLVFHPGGEFVYVVNELNSTVTACSYDPGKGVLTILHSVSTVQEDHVGAKHPAAIRMSKDGKYVYASTRGEHSKLSVFQAEKDGRITRIQVVEVTHWPREFNLDPSGNYLMVAGEKSDEIELFQIDKATGKLSPTKSRFGISSPACILYLD
jgi:6-phosphogluconolactonase